MCKTADLSGHRERLDLLREFNGFEYPRILHLIRVWIKVLTTFNMLPSSSPTKPRVPILYNAENCRCAHALAEMADMLVNHLLHRAYLIPTPHPEQSETKEEKEFGELQTQLLNSLRRLFSPSNEALSVRLMLGFVNRNSLIEEIVTFTGRPCTHEHQYYYDPLVRMKFLETSGRCSVECCRKLYIWERRQFQAFLDETFSGMVEPMLSMFTVAEISSNKSSHMRNAYFALIGKKKQSRLMRKCSEAKLWRDVYVVDSCYGARPMQLGPLPPIQELLLLYQYNQKSFEECCDGLRRAGGADKKERADRFHDLYIDCVLSRSVCMAAAPNLFDDTEEFNDATSEDDDTSTAISMSEIENIRQQMKTAWMEDDKEARPDEVRPGQTPQDETFSRNKKARETVDSAGEDEGLINIEPTSTWYFIIPQLRSVNIQQNQCETDPDIDLTTLY